MAAYVTLGTDSSGRPVRMSREFQNVWTQVCAAIGFTPVITQGGWLTNAASASAATHAGDAVDLRVWNLSVRQIEDTIRTLRAHGVAAWLRTVQHGGFTDPHIHAVPGRWAHPSPSALRQWDACRNGRDGLASNGRDYHSYPLATNPPEDDMFSTEDRDRAKRIEEKLDKILKLDSKRDKVNKTRAELDRAEHAETQGLVKGEG